MLESAEMHLISGDPPNQILIRHNIVNNGVRVDAAHWGRSRCGRNRAADVQLSGLGSIKGYKEQELHGRASRIHWPFSTRLYWPFSSCRHWPLSRRTSGFFSSAGLIVKPRSCWIRSFVNSATGLEVRTHKFRGSCHFS